MVNSGGRGPSISLHRCDEGDYLLGRPSSSVAKKTDPPCRWLGAARGSPAPTRRCAARQCSTSRPGGRSRSRPGRASCATTRCHAELTGHPVTTPNVWPPARRWRPSPFAPLARATQVGTSSGQGASMSCSILTSKVWSLRGSQADSERDPGGAATRPVDDRGLRRRLHRFGPGVPAPGRATRRGDRRRLAGGVRTGQRRPLRQRRRRPYRGVAVGAALRTSPPRLSTGHHERGRCSEG